MLKLIDSGKTISYTKDDTFSLEVGLDEDTAEGMSLKFVVSASESDIPVIEKTVNAEDDIFAIELTQSERNALSIGDYIFKIILYTTEGNIVTTASGDFIVKWGA